MSWIKFLQKIIRMVFRAFEGKPFQKEKKKNIKTELPNQKENLSSERSKVRVFVPTKYSHVEVISQTILSGKVSLVKIEKMDEMDKTKLLHFIFGVCYTLHIQPEMIDENTYVIDPFHTTPAKHQRDIEDVSKDNLNSKY